MLTLSMLSELKTLQIKLKFILTGQLFTIWIDFLYNFSFEVILYFKKPNRCKCFENTSVKFSSEVLSIQKYVNDMD
jgi:hypothetical protein